MATTTDKYNIKISATDTNAASTVKNVTQLFDKLTDAEKRAIAQSLLLSGNLNKSMKVDSSKLLQLILSIKGNISKDITPLKVAITTTQDNKIAYDNIVKNALKQTDLILKQLLLQLQQVSITSKMSSGNALILAGIDKQTARLKDKFQAKMKFRKLLLQLLNEFLAVYKKSNVTHKLLVDALSKMYQGNTKIAKAYQLKIKLINKFGLATKKAGDTTTASIKKTSAAANVAKDQYMNFALGMQQPFVILDKIANGLGRNLQALTMGLFGLQTIVWSVQGVVTLIQYASKGIK